MSTPNKIYTSPFLPKPLNPYHMNEFYLSQLLNLLREYGFNIDRVYVGRRVKRAELVRRILASLLKFCLSKLSLKSYLLDDLYHILSRPKHLRTLVDPDPNLFTHEEVKTLSSNIVLYQYFLIYAHL